MNEDDLWKLHKALYGHKKAPKLSHQHVVTILENLLTDPSYFRKDDLDIIIFIHVDDGLLFGPNSLSRQVMMRTVGRRVQKQLLFLGRVVKRTVRWNSDAANPKYIQNVITVLGLEDAKAAATPSLKRTQTTESLVQLQNERRAVYTTAVGKPFYLYFSRQTGMKSGISKYDPKETRGKKKTYLLHTGNGKWR